MKFKIVGADQETGEDVEIVVDARDEVAAETIANRRNITVSSVVLVRSEWLNAEQSAPTAPKQSLKCMECGMLVSSRNVTCPSCGASVKADTSLAVEALGRLTQAPRPSRMAGWPSRRSIIVVAAVYFGLIGVTVAVCTGGFNLADKFVKSFEGGSGVSGPTSREEQIKEHFSAWDGSHQGLTAYVKRHMNDPDSFEHDETRYSDEGDYLLIHMTFRGKNAFGGVVRNSVTAEVDLSGNVLEVLSQEP